MRPHHADEIGCAKCCERIRAEHHDGFKAALSQVFVAHLKSDFQPPMCRLTVLWVKNLVGTCGLCVLCNARSGGSVDPLLEELIALERSALDRWITLDPQGYLNLFAPDATYFDP